MLFSPYTGLFTGLHCHSLGSLFQSTIGLSAVATVKLKIIITVCFCHGIQHAEGNLIWTNSFLFDGRDDSYADDEVETRD